MTFSYEPYRTRREWQTPQRRHPVRIWTTENELFGMIRSRWQWPRVEQICTTHPNRASCERRDHMDNTALHIACRLKPPVSTVLALIQAEPKAVSSQNECGCTPLHLACLHNASVEVIASLFQADVDAVSTLSNIKRTPIHYACMSKDGLPVDSFRLMVEAATTTILTLKDGSGQDPLDLLFGVYNERLSRAVSDSDLTDPIVGCCGEFWEKVAILTETPHLSNSPSKEGDGLWMESAVSFVHTLLTRDHCPPELIYFAMVMHPYESESKDSNENLPLHIICLRSYQKEEEGGKFWLYMVRLLLQQNPDSACNPNKDGKLPLELAAQSGKQWKGEIELIFHAYPAAIARHDAIDCLCFPHVMSLATAKREARSFTTMFEMIRSKPDLFCVF